MFAPPFCVGRSRDDIRGLCRFEGELLVSPTQNQVTPSCRRWLVSDDGTGWNAIVAKQQSFREFEIIFVDDSSSDRSLEILNKYASTNSRARVFSIPHGFAGRCRNHGMKFAHGKYILFLDADDFYHPLFLQKMIESAEKTNADVVICSYYLYDSNLGKDISEFKFDDSVLKQREIETSSLRNKLFQLCNPAPWNKLWKMDKILSGAIEFDSMKSANDFSFVYTALAISKKISIVDFPLIHYRINQKDNITAGRRKTPDNILRAAVSLKLNLRRLGIFDRYRSTYYRCIMRSTRYEIGNIGLVRKLRFVSVAYEVAEKDIFFRSVLPACIPRFSDAVRKLKGLL